MRHILPAINCVTAPIHVQNATQKARLSLRRLGQIVEELSTTHDLNTLLVTAAERISDAMGVEACAIYLTDVITGQHTLAATRGLRAEAVGEVVLAPEEGLVGLVAMQLKPVNLADCSSHERYRYVPGVGEEPFHAFLGVPLIFHGRLLGVVIVLNRKRRRFSEPNVSFLFTLAVQLASQVELARITSSVVQAPDGRTDNWLEGVAAAPGIGIGTAVVLYSLTEVHSAPEREPSDPAAEEAALLAAVDHVRRELELLAEQAGGPTSQHASLLSAYAMIVTSEELVGGAVEKVRAGAWAPGAFKSTVEELATVFDSMEDAYLRERGRDIRDLGQRVLRQMMASDSSDIQYPESTILLGQDVSPIDLMHAPRDRIRGVISQRGSAFSHLAIIARALGIPAVTGLGDLPLTELDRRELVVDGYRGRLYVNPNPTLQREFLQLAQEERELSEFLGELHDADAVTPDGREVAVLVNAGLPDDIPLAMSAGAQGVGLYRTELLFMTRERFPTEDQQVRFYRQLLEAFAPDPVTIRTLDIGGDKQLPYMPISEPNPALGWRGIRVSLDHPEILHTQLRAVLRAAEGLNNAQLLFPMLSSIEELDQVLAHLEVVTDELREVDVEVRKPPVGVMIEVPSAVFQAALFAERADFLSIGTNDLTQYMLAVDRDNERVASLFDTLHPAVLRAISSVVECGNAHAKPVSVCGEIAADPAAMVLLLGMGVASLSVNAGDTARVKWVIRSIAESRARELLQQALQMPSAGAIRDLITDVLVEAGLGGLVRPGRL